MSQLFGKVQDMLEGDHSLLFILIDEVSMHAALVIVVCQHAGGSQEAYMQLPGHQHAAATLVLLQVESLAASRQSGASSEPADSVRAVNALLTQLDALKGHANVMVRGHTAGLRSEGHALHSWQHHD